MLVLAKFVEELQILSSLIKFQPLSTALGEWPKVSFKLDSTIPLMWRAKYIGSVNIAILHLGK